MRIPILTYHSIDNSGSVISMSPPKFREQMEFLKNRNIPVVSLSQVAASLRGEQKLPEQALAITFDDGFRNFHHAALPILQDFGFPATVFVVAGRCGESNNWYGQMEGIPVLDLMGWDEVADACGRGIVIGSHTWSHPDLSRCSAAQVEDEIARSCEEIQKRTGKPAQSFAYPYGILSRDADAMVRKTFRAACSVILDFVTGSSDAFFLPRIDMYYFSRNNLFSSYGRGAFSAYVRARALLRSLRGNSGTS